MKCSQTGGLIYIVLTIFLIPTNARLLSYLAQGNKVKLKNTINTKRMVTNVDLFPDLQTPALKHHKIVKKQMTDVDYVNKRKTKRSLKKSSITAQSYSQLVNPHDEFSRDLSEEKETELMPSLSDSLEEKIMASSLKNLGRGYFRVPDTDDYRFFYECETEPSGFLQVQRRKCPDGEVFEPKFLECLKVSFLETIKYRTKRLPIFRKKIGTPDSTADTSDTEPSNEWIDASSDCANRIPSEFKPKQKPRLKIFYLRAKRKRYLPNEIYEDPRILDPGFKMSTLQQDNFYRKNSVQHHNPRSFFVRKDKDEAETVREKGANEDDDDNEEDEDEDCEEEEDDDAEESIKKKKKALGKDSNVKEFMKTAKAAVSNKVKYNESPGSIAFDNINNKNINNNLEKSNLKSESGVKTESTSSGSDVEDKKVLIDASIKVDSAISNALKNIITKSKEKEGADPETKMKYAMDKQAKTKVN